MKKKIRPVVYIILSFVCVVVIFDACKHDAEIINSDDLVNNKTTIQLKWNSAYQTQTKQEVEIGFLWALSFLGADLPKGSFNEAIFWNGDKLNINFSGLGFNEKGLDAISRLIYLFKQSEEYKKTGAIDLGRFIALTLNSSKHYYAITGIAKTFDEFKRGKIFDRKQFVATNSTISSHDRIIDLPDSSNMDYIKDAYIANECTGKVSEGNNKITSFEVAEQMRNGQFRFAIYDTTGILLSAANGAAGKPAKCLWCHEIYIQTLHADQVDEPSFYSAEQFKYIVSRNTSVLKNYRNTLTSDIDYERKQDHTFTELLYISFMEPSAERLALEWGMSLESVKEKLAGLSTHLHAEFGYLGKLYFRDEVDKLAPYTSVIPPSSAREKSLYEPDLIK